MKPMSIWRYGLVLSLLLTALPASAAVVGRTVAYQHAGENFVGYLAYDDSRPGKLPGVLVVHEWWGLNDYVRRRVEQLAALGYVAFGLDMYGQGRVTTHPAEAGQWAKQVNGNVVLWRERAQAGVAVLRSEARVDPERMAAIGYCFGGATVQQLAFAGAQLSGVASFHGSLIHPQPEEVPRVRARILILHGAADAMITPEQVQGYMKAMGETALNWEVIAYGGARHGFTNPGADALGMEALRYHPVADARSWERLRVFLAECFAP
jgi:dienelactone hydrolase